MGFKPLIYGLSGPALTERERRIFAAYAPAGFILFGRNIESPAQVRALTDDLRAVTQRARLAILIDQEGGRVARLKPPHWPDFPSAARFAAGYAQAPMTAIEAMRANAKAMGLALAACGITITCAPVLDLHYAQTHAAIGDRALGHDPLAVAALGRAMLDGLAKAGVAGVLKHMPGQGRAAADSHVSLPLVLATAKELDNDLAPFRALADAPFGMVAHVGYRAWDAGHPASQSALVIDEVIRGRIGFRGLLFSDDIGMDALSGSVVNRALACLSAGCDLVLHCSGDAAEMEALARALPDAPAPLFGRLDAALLSAPSTGDSARLAALLAKRDSLLSISA